MWIYFTNHKSTILLIWSAIYNRALVCMQKHPLTGWVLTNLFPATPLGDLGNEFTVILLHLQVLELRDRIRDQMITVKCMHEVMQNQQKALCSSSRQGLINDCVEHEKDSSFYLHKTREFQFKSETLISKIWNVVQTYEASLSGAHWLMCTEGILLLWGIVLQAAWGSCSCRFTLLWQRNIQRTNRRSWFGGFRFV